jgi:hypothetical protein
MQATAAKTVRMNTENFMATYRMLPAVRPLRAGQWRPPINIPPLARSYDHVRRSNVIADWLDSVSALSLRRFSNSVSRSAGG